MYFTTATCCVILLFAGGFADPEPHHNGHPSREVGHPFKLCVPEKAYKPCLKMVEQGKSLGIRLVCVTARDRMDCVEKIENHNADWGALEPEDMYVAAKHDNKYYRVFKEIRTKEEPENEFRYEAVAVIHKDLEINDLHQLRGLKSCHTGVGRNVGYKIPITKLTKMGILPPLNNTNISPRENELHALSQFFSKACLVGKWAPDTETNTRLKSQYANLCALCEFPQKCDYPDANSGYEGALRCLTKGGGEVAWTKVIYVKKVFGMPYGTKPAAQVDVNPNDYMYLCNDATKKPLTGPPCTWAARPWPGYVANEEITDVSSELKELRDEIKKLNDLGESSHADWITSVLALNNETLAVDSKTVITPQEYLDKAKYTDVIERDVMKPARKVRLCVSSDVEKEKCITWKKAAFSRDIRPEMDCILKSSQEECMDAINKNEADIVSIDVGFLNKAESKKLEPVISEVYEDKKTSQNVVALVKKTSSFKSFNDLKGGKACVPKIESAIWIASFSAMSKKNFIPANSCPRTKAFSEFFTGGVKESNNPIHCLQSGEGDCAFVGSEEIRMAEEHPDQFNMESYEILRPEGGRCEMNKANECHMGQVPARVMVAKKDLSQVELDDIKFCMLSSGKMFNRHANEHVFKLFGNYNSQLHVIVTNYAVGFTNNHEAAPAQEDFKKVVKEVYSCPHEHDHDHDHHHDHQH